MKVIRWAAVAATALISLMNVPIAFGGSDDDIATPFAVVISLVGLAGLVAAFGLARRLPWGRPAVLAIGVLNLAGAVVALANSWEGAAIGLVVSLLVVALGWFSDRRTDTVPAFG
jgi:peptidoglycan/LPS O-acetylase OafA/YrhL